MSAPGFSTTIVHRGEGGPAAASLTTPIYETTTFLFESAAAVRRYNERGDGFLYTRYGNPTVVAVEERLAAADGAERSILFASGMAATATLMLSLLKSGDEVVCSAGIYGGTHHLLHDLLPRFGVTPRFVGLEQLARLEDVLTERSRLVWFESPVNPHLRCVDVRRVAEACRARGVLSAIDNTFASPVNQRPLDLGVDLVMQSATKYLNGHSDVTAGVVAGRGDLVEPVDRARRVLGGILDPQAAYALGRALKTLELRVRRQNETAGSIAQALEGHPALAHVYYPGLPSHPDHAVAARQMTGFGGMICLDLAGGEAAAVRAFDRLRLVRRAASLGGVESLCSLPILTSHTGFSDEQLAAAGVTRGMIRLSIGLEDPADLLADLRQALESSGA
jgi:cystathionine beta-lyase/cystathionine gamma-synthase